MRASADNLGLLPRRAPAVAMLAALRRIGGWPARVYRARRLMHQLSALGEHELRDIGLTRLDLQATSALPFDADPSLLLRRRAESRRR